MVGIVPKLTLNGLGDYAMLAIGIVIGTAIFQAPLDTIQANLKSTDGGV
jgi:hypothetical protein